MKSNFNEVELPLPVQPLLLFGPETQPVVPVVRTIPWSNPTEFKPPENVPDGTSVLKVRLALLTVIPEPTIALAKVVALDELVTTMAWAGALSAKAIAPNSKDIFMLLPLKNEMFQQNLLSKTHTNKFNLLKKQTKPTGST